MFLEIITPLYAQPVGNHRVSFNPAQSWKLAPYDVKYYQLNDQRVLIAQTSFRIDQVID